jgi:hypothetical protein
MKFYGLENSVRGVAQKQNHDVYYNAIVPAAECGLCGKWVSVSNAPLFVRDGVQDILGKMHVSKSGMSPEQIGNLRSEFSGRFSGTPFLCYINDVKPGMAIKFTVIKKRRTLRADFGLLTPQLMLIPDEVGANYSRLDDSGLALPIRYMLGVESGVSLIFAPRCPYDEGLYNVCRFCFRGKEIEEKCLEASEYLTGAESDFVKETGIAFLERETKIIVSEEFVEKIQINTSGNNFMMKEVDVH